MSHGPWCNPQEEVLHPAASRDSQNTTDWFGLWHGGRKLESHDQAGLAREWKDVIWQRRSFRQSEFRRLLYVSRRPTALFLSQCGDDCWFKLLKCAYCCCWCGSEMCWVLKPGALCFILKMETGTVALLPFVLLMSLQPPGSLAHPRPLWAFGL